MAEWPQPDDDKDGDAAPSLPLIKVTGKGLEVPAHKGAASKRVTISTL
jgi:hypothetical protein